VLDDYKEGQALFYNMASNAILNNKVSHAYLFVSSSSKDINIIKAFAKSLICPSNKFSKSNCGNCNICFNIDNDNYPELKIIKPDGMWIKKEQLSDLKNDFNNKKVLGNKRVYIILECEKLNKYAANSILKFLEEPQEGVIAILITSNMYQLLETIISRCQIISLNGQADIEKNAKTLIKIGKILTEDDESFEKFTNDENNVEKINAILKFIDYYENNHKKVLLHLNEYWFKYFNDKENISKALMIIIYFYKDVLNYKSPIQYRIGLL